MAQVIRLAAIFYNRTIEGIAGRNGAFSIMSSCLGGKNFYDKNPRRKDFILHIVFSYF
jgi:hypothetical protein